MPFLRTSQSSTQQQFDLIIASKKLKNTPTLQGLDSFYINHEKEKITSFSTNLFISG